MSARRSGRAGIWRWYLEVLSMLDNVGHRNGVYRVSLSMNTFIQIVMVRAKAPEPPPPPPEGNP